MAQRLITLSNPVAGDEAGYAAWYANQHLHDVIRVPGVLGGQFFTAADPANARWRHLAVYEIEDPAAVVSGIQARRGTPEMPLHELDKETLVFFTAEPLGPWVGADERSANCRLLAISKAKPGQEAAFDAWYDGQHIPDMLRIPGFTGAQRFRTRSRDGGELTWPYAALYAAQADEPLGLLKSIGARAGTDEMPISDALDRTVGVTTLFVAATPHHTSN
jgi:hypothetical protein